MTSKPHERLEDEESRIYMMSDAGAAGDKVISEEALSLFERVKETIFSKGTTQQKDLLRITSEVRSLEGKN